MHFFLSKKLIELHKSLPNKINLIIASIAQISEKIKKNKQKKESLGKIIQKE
jgi:hypothetical protein